MSFSIFKTKLEKYGKVQDFSEIINSTEHTYVFTLVVSIMSVKDTIELLNLIKTEYPVSNIYPNKEGYLFYLTESGTE